MTNQDLIKGLYEEIALFNQNSSFDWSDVLEAIKPELDKCVTNECISN